MKLFLTYNTDRAFFTNNTFTHYTMLTRPDVCKSLSFLLDNIYVRVGDTVYRQVNYISMVTNCTPLAQIYFCTA